MSIEFTLLIVDDESTNLAVLKQMLQDDYHLLFARDGNNALQLALQEKPNLILLDIMMPEISGFDILKEIEKDNNLNNLKIILVSVLERENRIEKILENKNIDYVQKPIILNNLLFKINNFLN